MHVSAPAEMNPSFLIVFLFFLTWIANKVKLVLKYIPFTIEQVDSFPKAILYIIISIISSWF